MSIPATAAAVAYSAVELVGVTVGVGVGVVVWAVVVFGVGVVVGGDHGAVTSMVRV